MGIRDWINGLRKRQVPVQGAVTDQQIARWQKALSDFEYPYDSKRKTYTRTEFFSG